MGIFHTIEEKIDIMMVNLGDAIGSTQISALKDVFFAYMSLWITVKGYLILSGKSSEPFKELIFDAAIKIIVVSVVLSPSWISLVTNAIDGINSWASGSISLYTKLDETMELVIRLADSIWHMSHEYVIPGLAILAIVAGFAFFSIFAAWVLISTTLTLKILVLLTPFMIASVYFGWLKDIFTSWIRLIAANTLTVLMVSLFLQAIDGMYKNIILHVRSSLSDSNLLMSALGILIFSVIIALSIYLAKGIAQQLASASIEHLPDQAARDYREHRDRARRR